MGDNKVGRGQVKIHSDSALPEMHGLNQTLGPEYTAWVTVTHQLHCLVSGTLPRIVGYHLDTCLSISILSTNLTNVAHY